MGRTPLSMAPMALALLRRSGYRVLNVGYSSQGPSVAEIGAGLAAEIDAELERAPAPRVHIVGHSLGTVAARWVLAHDPPPVPGRVVMLAPPNRGSQAADRLAGAVGWLLPPIRELRTTDTPAADLVLPDGVEVAVIAGDRDGKVSVAETCLAGAHHAVVRSRHTFIMMRPPGGRAGARVLGDGPASRGLSRRLRRVAGGRRRRAGHRPRARRLELVMDSVPPLPTAPNDRHSRARGNPAVESTSAVRSLDPRSGPGMTV